MGTILQESVQQCLHTISIKERKWPSNSPDLPSNIMGRQQSQRESTLCQNHTPQSQVNNHFTEKRPQQRRKNKAYNKGNILQTSAHETADSVCHVAPPAGEKGEARLHHCRYREHTHGHPRSKHAAVHQHCHLPDSSPELLGGQRSKQGHCDPGKSDSDTDLSDSERLPAPPSASFVPPQLDLLPEVMDPDEFTSEGHRPRGPGHRDYPFPDFLPPPFNGWNLGHLALFHGAESCRPQRHRPVDPLERYLERLLQLEWRQLQSVGEEMSGVSEAFAGCQRTRAATHPAARLSSPKSILQCQRAFPLTLLSSMATHSALLSGCTCSSCRQRRYAPAAGVKRCCHLAHAPLLRSRPGPPGEHDPASLPKRSYSETRVHAWDRRAPSAREQGLVSPVRGNSHLRRMQALGNIRNPAVPGALAQPRPTAGDPCCYGAPGQGSRWPRDMRASDYRSGGLRNRSSSERRRGGAERREGRYEKRRSGSECRGGANERWGGSALNGQEIKPDAVAAIMDNLPASKHSPLSKSKKTKQVEFVT